ncbi:MAG TPA: SGNH/GDSL hydrolase family protein [Pyrinomonadaceae bacterium]|nr:SGNH/GDSL hydrolase family protein [Pyrinomonadaceae bacterium]
MGESGAAGAQVQGAGAARKAEPVVYVALGDSTGVGVGAQKGGGYVARLFERVGRERAGSRVVNLCVSGAETGDVLRSQVPRVGRERPTLVTLGVGINDLTHGVEVEQFARNYEEIVTRVRAATDAPLVVTNIPDISTAPRVPAFMRAGVSQRIALFNEEIREIAARHDLRLVDAYGMSREVIPAHPEFFSADGFHPSDAGYEYWAKMMWPALASVIDE